MDADAKIRLSEDIAFQYAGDKVIVMQAQGSLLYTLNGTGAAIWKLLDRVASLREIQSQMETRYDGDAAQKRQEVEQFVQQLLDSGVAVIQP